MPPSTAARRNSLTPEQERAAQIEFARQNQASQPAEPEPEEPAADTAEDGEIAAPAPAADRGITALSFGEFVRSTAAAAA